MIRVQLLQLEIKARSFYHLDVYSRKKDNSGTKIFLSHLIWRVTVRILQLFHRCIDKNNDECNTLDFVPKTFKSSSYVKSQ